MGEPSSSECTCSRRSGSCAEPRVRFLHTLGARPGASAAGCPERGRAAAAQRSRVRCARRDQVRRPPVDPRGVLRRVVPLRRALSRAAPSGGTAQHCRAARQHSRLPLRVRWCGAHRRRNRRPQPHPSRRALAAGRALHRLRPGAHRAAPRAAPRAARGAAAADRLLRPFRGAGRRATRARHAARRRARAPRRRDRPGARARRRLDMGVDLHVGHTRTRRRPSYARSEGCSSRASAWR